MAIVKECNLCSGEKFSEFLTGSDQEFPILGEYTLSKCCNCGLIFLNPQIEDSKLFRHYPSDNYYSFSGYDEKEFIKRIYWTYYSGEGSFFMKIILFPLKSLIRGTKIVPGGRILDIGCGSGSFLKTMKDFGMVVHGVEPGDFDEAFVEKNKLNIIKKNLENVKYPGNYFDVITISHVLEHVRDPLHTLKEISRILKKDGTLILETPKRDSFTCKLFGKNWRPYDIPRHFHIFRTIHLKTYAKKSGLKIIHGRSFGESSFLSSFLFFLNNFRNRKRYLSEKTFVQNKILKYSFLPISFFLNIFGQGDQIGITLTK